MTLDFAEEAMGRKCEAWSKTYQGHCLIDDDCKLPCRDEGFPKADCDGFRRRCLCKKQCSQEWSNCSSVHCMSRVNLSHNHKCCLMMSSYHIWRKIISSYYISFSESIWSTLALWKKGFLFRISLWIMTLILGKLRKLTS